MTKDDLFQVSLIVIEVSKAKPMLCPRSAKGEGPLETHNVRFEVQGLGPRWGLGRSPMLAYP